MILGVLVLVVGMLSYSFMSGAEAAACSAGAISMNVTTAAELQNMIDTINCTGEGFFHATWTGSLQLGQRIELSDSKTLTITGSRPVLTNLPSAVIDAGGTTGIFGVSNGSTLTLDNLVLQGGASENGAAVDVRSFSSVHVSGCVFVNNNSTTGGENTHFIIFTSYAIYLRHDTAAEKLVLSDA